VAGLPDPVIKIGILARVSVEQNRLLLKAPVLQRLTTNKTNKIGKTGKASASRRMRSELHLLPTL